MIFKDDDEADISENLPSPVVMPDEDAHFLLKAHEDGDILDSSL